MAPSKVNMYLFIISCSFRLTPNRFEGISSARQSQIARFLNSASVGDSMERVGVHGAAGAGGLSIGDALDRGRLLLEGSFGAVSEVPPVSGRIWKLMLNWVSEFLSSLARWFFGSANTSLFRISTAYRYLPCRTAPCL